MAISQKLADHTHPIPTRPHDNICKQVIEFRQVDAEGGSLTRDKRHDRPIRICVVVERMQVATVQPDREEIVLDRDFQGAGRNMRHPVYVTDAIRGLELCAETQDIDGEVFIIAGKSPVEARELVNVISKELNIRAQKVHLPIFLGQAAGLALELTFKLIGRQPPFSRRSMDFFLKHNAYTIAKAQSILNYQPQVDLPTGIRKTIQSIKTS